MEAILSFLYSFERIRTWHDMAVSLGKKIMEKFTGCRKDSKVGGGGELSTKLN